MEEAEKVAALEKELAELRPLKDSSTKTLEEFQAKEAAWLQEKKDLEEAANPNWKRMREQNARLQELAKEKGITLDADGNPVGASQNVNIEDIRREAAQSVTQGFLSNRLEELLEDYTKEQAEVIKHQYGKLTQGEQVSMQNIKNFVEAAVGASGFPKPNRAAAGINAGGTGPRIGGTQPALSTENAQAAAERMGVRLAKE